MSNFPRRSLLLSRVSKEKGRKHKRFRPFCGNHLLSGEVTEERVAFLDQCPRQVQPASIKRGQFSEDRICADHFRQRRIEGFLVAAEMGLAAETARGDLNQV